MLGLHIQAAKQKLQNFNRVVDEHLLLLDKQKAERECSSSKDKCPVGINILTATLSMARALLADNVIYIQSADRDNILNASLSYMAFVNDKNEIVRANINEIVEYKLQLLKDSGCSSWKNISDAMLHVTNTVMDSRTVIENDIKPITYTVTPGIYTYKYCNIDFDKPINLEIDAPNFNAYLNNIANNRDAFVKFIGANFSPDHSRLKMYAHLYGGGDNGKTSFLAAMVKFLDSSACMDNTGGKTFETQFFGSELKGCLTFVIDECNNPNAFKTGKWKSYVGSPTVTAEEKKIQKKSTFRNTTYFYVGSNVKIKLPADVANETRYLGVIFKEREHCKFHTRVNTPEEAVELFVKEMHTIIAYCVNFYKNSNDLGIKERDASVFEAANKEMFEDELEKVHSRFIFTGKEKDVVKRSDVGNCAVGFDKEDNIKKKQFYDLLKKKYPFIEEVNRSHIMFWKGVKEDKETSRFNMNDNE